MEFPAQLVQFMGYHGDNGISDALIGVADITLPDLTYISEVLKGPGILGEVDMPVLGNFQSMVTTINWHSLVDSNAVFIAPKIIKYDFRGAIQILNPLTDGFELKQVKYIMRGLSKKLALGNLKTAELMGTNLEYETVYFKFVVNNRDVFELDKLNPKCIIDGVDYLEELRRHLGLL